MFSGGGLSEVEVSLKCDCIDRSENRALFSLSMTLAALLLLLALLSVSLGLHVHTAKLARVLQWG